MYSYKTDGVSENDGPNYDSLWMVPLRHIQEINFQLQCKSDARIGLSANVGMAERRTYEIMLGKQLDGGNELWAIRYIIILYKYISGEIKNYCEGTFFLFIFSL